MKILKCALCPILVTLLMASTIWASDLPAGVKFRLKNMERSLVRAEKALKKDLPSAKKVKSVEGHMKAVYRYWKQIHKYYKGKFDPQHPDYVKAKQRVEAVEKALKTLKKGGGEEETKAPPEKKPSPEKKKLSRSVKYRLELVKSYLDRAEKSLSGNSLSSAKRSLSMAEKKWSELERRYQGKFDRQHPEIAAVVAQLKKLKASLSQSENSTNQVIKKAKRQLNQLVSMVHMAEGKLKKLEGKVGKRPLSRMDKRSLQSTVKMAQRIYEKLVTQYPSLKEAKDPRVQSLFKRYQGVVAGQEALLARETGAASKQKAAKEDRIKQSQIWTAKIKPYITGQTPKYLDRGLVNQAFFNTAAPLSSVVKSVKEALSRLKGAREFLQSYQKESFPNGKTSDLKYAAGELVKAVKSMEDRYQQGVEHCLERTKERFSQGEAFMAKQKKLAQKKADYVPNGYTAYRLVEARKYLDRLQVVAKWDKSRQAKLVPLVAQWEKRYLALRRQCRDILAIQGHRRVFLPHKYTGSDGDKVKEKARSILLRDLAKKTSPMKVKIIDTHIIQDWVTKKKWVWKDSRKTSKVLRVWRELRVQIAARPVDGQARFRGGRLHHKNKNSGPYRGLALGDGYIHLFQVYLYSDKKAGKWHRPLGYLTSNQPLAKANLNGKTSPVPKGLFQTTKSR